MNARDSNNIAVVVAHPDDEVLAFGGTIARHAARGDTVRVLLLATGLTSRGEHDDAALETLRGQARRASELLGAEPPMFAEFPDNRMDSVALLDVVKTVEAFFEPAFPDVVFTHHGGDLNVDHGICARAVLTAARPLPGRPAARIYAGEVLSSSEYAAPADRFVPNTYVDIAAHLEQKKAALAAYEDEVRPFPHPRSPDAVEHLARLRGSESGLEAAEGLQLLRAVFS
ncbi:MAG: PIG-L family deacetylase [Rhodospirillales bacterium]